MVDNKLNSLSLQNIIIKDPFWSRYIDLVHNTVIPHQWQLINDLVEDAEPSYSMQNFKIAAGLAKGSFGGAVFQDTDIAKWLEAAAYSLAIHPNEALEKLADDTIELIAKSQHEDGYINTYFTIQDPKSKWENLQETHELYTAGHLIEAAVAYYEATGKDRFLKVMCRFADLISERFGLESGKCKGYPGHQEIELALIKLYRVTQNTQYLETAKYFIDERGSKPHYFLEDFKRRGNTHFFPEYDLFDITYAQSHIPPIEQETAEGHAVRAVYMYTAMADLAYEYKNEALLATCEKLYNNIVNRRMYITGSIGSAAFGERFTCDYDLPNDTNYSETCASIGLAMFCQRMLHITKDSKYADTMERALYNTLLSGISLTGKEFFYVNPLEVWPESCHHNTSKTHVKTERQKWFGIACCPPNIARTLASLGQYIYSQSEDTLYTNLFVSNETNIKFGNHFVHISQATNYPFNNQVTLTINASIPTTFNLAIRIPAFSKQISIVIDNVELAHTLPNENGYLVLTKTWDGTCTLNITFDMPPQFIEANPNVRANIGHVALMKGPLVYCLEEIDNSKNLHALQVDVATPITEHFDQNLLGGTLTLNFIAEKVDQSNWEDVLYKPAESTSQSIPTTVKAIPYPLWNNRGEGEMLVWLRKKL